MPAVGGILLRFLHVAWQRYLIALLLGVSGAAALPPYFVLPMIWVSLSGYLFLIVTAETKRQAAFEGWLFGLGWFAAGLYWIGYAFLVDRATYGALMPFAVAGISAGMAIYMVCLSAALHWLRARFAISLVWTIPVFASLWTIFEWTRGWFLTGFPWNPLASVWGFSVEMMQPAAFVGALGLGFASALIFVAPVILLESGAWSKRRNRLLFASLMFVLPLLWGLGSLRLDRATMLTHDGVVLRLVQPAIPQALKWQPELRHQHVLRQMSMSKRSPGPSGSPTAVIWAETNVPFLIDKDAEVTAALAAAVPDDGTLIFGAPRRDDAGNVYNSLLSVNGEAEITGTFDKFHLVPFGEYVPLRGILPFEKLTAGRGDFAPGPGPKTLRLENLPSFAAIICYEVIFAGKVVDQEDRPEWILNITNDAWFGPSSGPYQHLVQARLRAIEEGLPLVRVANNGISAVIDAHGRVRNQLGLDKVGVVDALLPIALDRTLFARMGESLPLAFAFGILILSVIVARKRERLS